MSYPVIYAPENSTIYIPFATYSGSTGASITMSGLLASDIEIYKNGSTTQRASDNGYTLLDTDGTDFDGITGIHAISIDLSNNSDAGFYSVGSWYFVVVSTITVDSQTVSFIAALFRIMEAENATGVPDVNVTHWNGSAVATPSVGGVPEVDITHFNGTAGTFASGRPEVNATHLAGTAVSASSGLINANVTQISGDSTAADNLEAALDGTGGVTISGSLSGSVGSISGVVFPTNFSAIAIDSSGIVDSNLEKIHDVQLTGNGDSTPFDVV